MELSETVQAAASGAGGLPVLRLLDIREQPLDVAEVMAAVQDARAGGVAVFVGAVRDHDQQREVAALDYSSHPSALARLTEVATGVAERHQVHGIAAVHRTGHLDVGDAAVVVVAAASHRDQAFEAARALIDDLKASVPIWKHQVFADGEEEWVGTP
jgi:molybdopterin synthase catalytic subunit